MCACVFFVDFASYFAFVKSPGVVVIIMYARRYNKHDNNIFQSIRHGLKFRKRRARAVIHIHAKLKCFVALKKLNFQL